MTYQIVTPGSYLADVKAAEWTTTKGGAPMLKVEMGIVGGEFDGSKLWTYLVDSEKAAKFRDAKLAGFGITSQAYAGMSPPQVVAAVFGLRVQVETILNEWNGKTYANVESLRLSTQPEPDSPQPSAEDYVANPQFDDDLPF